MASKDPNDPMSKRFEKGEEPPIKRLMVFLGIIGFIGLMSVIVYYLFAGL